MPAAKPVQMSREVKFDDAMRGLMRVPAPPSGKKAKRAAAPKKTKSPPKR